MLDQHAGDAGAGADLAALGHEPVGHGPGEPAGAALGHREADGLAAHRQQQAEQARAGGVHGDVGVQRVAGDQQLARLGGEPLAAHRRRRLQQGADVVQAAHPGQPGERLASPPLTGGNGVSSASTSAGPMVSQSSYQLPPGLAVAGVVLLQPGDGLLHVAVQHRPGAVGQRVAEHGGRVHPAQAVLLQVQGRDDRRGGRQRVERAEGVVHEAAAPRRCRCGRRRPPRAGSRAPARPSRRPPAGWPPPGRWARPRSTTASLVPDPRHRRPPHAQRPPAAAQPGPQPGCDRRYGTALAARAACSPPAPAPARCRARRRPPGGRRWRRPRTAGVTIRSKTAGASVKPAIVSQFAGPHLDHRGRGWSSSRSAAAATRSGLTTGGGGRPTQPR